MGEYGWFEEDGGTGTKLECMALRGYSKNSCKCYYSFSTTFT